MIQHGARTTETKPRLAKDEVDKLEREFQRNHKPNSSLKKQLAEEMRVDIARINVLTPYSTQITPHRPAHLADMFAELVSKQTSQGQAGETHPRERGSPTVGASGGSAEPGRSEGVLS